MSSSVEQRLTQVEIELAQIKGDLKSIRPVRNWIESIIGTFENDTDFIEVLRLGKEIRDAEQPEE